MSSTAPSVPPSGPSITARPGTVPPPRDGNVAYFANLSCLFFDNEELTDELRAKVKTLTTYGGRLVPIISLLWSGSNNILALERRPLPLVQDYFGQELGLHLPRIMLDDPHAQLTSELEEIIRDTPDLHLDGFVTDQRITDIAIQTGARLAGSKAGSRLGNDKLLLHRYLKEAGENVFEAIEASTPEEVAAAARDLSKRGYRFAAAKSAIGASGIGLVRFPTDKPPPIPPSHFRDGPCMIEGWLDPNVEGISHIASPSVQMVLTHDTIHLYDITDQILSDQSVHEGNVSPPESFGDPSLGEELLRQAGVAGNWLHAQGYRGTASTDFHLAFRRDGGIEVRVCELNARVTGATYPSLLARHFLPEATWLMRNLLLPEPVEGQRILEDLNAANLLFRNDAQRGVIPINLNQDEDGLISKGQFLFLGRNLRDVHELVDHTLALHDLEFDRD